MAQSVDSASDFGVPADAKDLAKCCREAFEKTRTKKSCSHTVWHVLQNMEYKLEGKKWPYMEANPLIDKLSGQTSIWQTVGIDKAHELANKGIVIIGGRKGGIKKDKGGNVVKDKDGKEESEHGHVIIVYPGPKKHTGVYLIPDKDHPGKMITMPSRGLYPRALSVSAIKWPGVISCGDKTVRDPWSDKDYIGDKKNPGVQYWATLFCSTVFVEKEKS